MRKASPRPDVRRPRRWNFPQPVRRQLGNGLRVAVFQRDGQHIASAALVLDAPLSLERPEIEGVATLVAQCLTEGTRAHPGSSYAEAVESRGASVFAVAGHSATQVLLDVPTHALEEGLALMAEAAAEPALDAADVERQRELRLADIDQEYANSAVRAGIAFRSACVPRRFRAARPAGGEPGTLEAVSAADVAAFHDAYYRPDGATLIVAGDFVGDPLPAIEAAFGRWAPSAGQDVRHELPQAKKPRYLLVDRPGAVQADIRLGAFGLDSCDPAYADLAVGCRALGGLFLSRLNKELREERGYTYGVGLGNHPFRSGGLASLQGSFRTEVVVDALDRARVLMDVTAAPITDAEVVEAVAYERGIMPLRYSTAEGLVLGAASLAADGLTADFVDAFTQALLLVTPQSATQALQTVLPPDRLTLVVVGDADALAGPLDDAGWPVKVISQHPETHHTRERR